MSMFGKRPHSVLSCWFFIIFNILNTIFGITVLYFSSDGRHPTSFYASASGRLTPYFETYQRKHSFIAVKL